VIVVDTSFVYALLDRRDSRHDEAVAWYRQIDEEMATTPLVLAEADHLAVSRAGVKAARAFRDDLRAGAYIVEWWPEAATQCAELAEQYEGLGIGLTDASLVVLADRLGTIRLATFDERHFRAVRPLGGGSFAILPMAA